MRRAEVGEVGVTSRAAAEGQVISLERLDCDRQPSEGGGMGEVQKDQE